MRTVCIIQSRLGSTRFPRKALADIEGKPMLARVVERAQQIRGVDWVVVAVPPSDGVEIHNALNPDTFHVKVAWPAVDENDVLARFFCVKTSLGAQVVVRLTGDCPLVDPNEASAMLDMMGEYEYDYITNRGSDTDGLDVEVVTARALHRADDEATSAYDREHVTSYIYSSGLFKCAQYRGRAIPNGEKWSVDTPADLELVRRRYREQMVLV